VGAVGDLADGRLEVVLADELLERQVDQRDQQQLAHHTDREPDERVRPPE